MSIYNENGPGDIQGKSSQSGAAWGGISSGNTNPSRPGQPGQPYPSEQPTRPQTHPGNPQTDPQRLSPDPSKPETPKTDPTYPETNPKSVPTPVSEYKKSEQDESFKNSDKGGALGGDYSTAKNYSTSPSHIHGSTERAATGSETGKDNDDIVGWINELVVINNDRTEGYKRAAEETEESDLKSLFLRYSSQSRTFHTDLVQLVRKHHGEPAEGTKISGKLYRVWMDVKAAITAKDRKAVLASCEFGEDEALSSYEAVLKKELPADVSQLVRQQKAEIQQAHDHIKQMRDSAK